MKFKTSISKTKDGKHLIYGQDIVKLIEENSFVEVMFLLLRGTLPQANEQELLNAALVASVENGLEAPSLYVPRVVAASGNQMHTALAAGMLSIGEKHGGAAEAAAQVLSSGKSAEEIVKEYKIVPGFGHKVYKDSDPRAQALHKKAKKLGFSCKYFNLAEDIEKQLLTQKNKTLPLNIDGALACCMLELKFNPNLGKALFLIARIVAMSAHVSEELDQKNNYYRLEESDIVQE